LSVVCASEVTLAVMLRGKIDGKKAAMYMICQFVGGILGAVIGDATSGECERSLITCFVLCRQGSPFEWLLLRADPAPQPGACAIVSVVRCLGCLI
jgi:hypothetical protein